MTDFSFGNTPVRRQELCRQRGRRARLLARLLIPVLLITCSAAIWSEPRLRAELERGLETIRPVAQAIMDGTPPMQALAEARQRAAAEAPRDALAENLPAARTRVNRPGSATN